jgi:hypothetical protein
MTYEINRKPSKSGKRTLFFPTINGKRITRTNFSRRWEAVGLAKHVITQLTK